MPEAPRLGTQGLMTSAMGLGCMRMSEFYAGRDGRDR
jgi:aryl-alcohol dehydrogenase-like predicted oxidoreductase